MPEPVQYRLRPSILVLAFVTLFFGACTVGLGAVAWSGDTDLHRIRDLPLSEGGKVAVLWVLAALSAAMTLIAFAKVPGVLRPVLLTVGADFAEVPHGLGLRKRTRLVPGELLAVGDNDYGAGVVLQVEWEGGKAYLPRSWFADPAAYAEAKRALSDLRDRGAGLA
jgi:hypothetical protein